MQPEADFDPFAERRRPTVGEKEDEYRQKRRRLVISPERSDPFADGGFSFWFLVIFSLVFKSNEHRSFLQCFFGDLMKPRSFFSSKFVR